MKIQLDHVQRLNLHALLGAQRGDVATIRALWAVQDRLALTPEEENAIELKRAFAGRQEHAIWNPERSIPPKEFDFTEPEVARIKAALEAWHSYGAAADRYWLEPIIQMLFPSNQSQPIPPLIVTVPQTD